MSIAAVADALSIRPLIGFLRGGGGVLEDVLSLFSLSKNHAYGML